MGMALGAGTPEIVKLIACEAMALTFSGVIIGIAGAVWAARVLAGQLYGVKSNDVVTFAGVAALLLVTAMLAAYSGTAFHGRRSDVRATGGVAESY
jgi:ABC-type antimicrobial peptide transport system permease subunit